MYGGTSKAPFFCADNSGRAALFSEIRAAAIEVGLWKHSDAVRLQDDFLALRDTVCTARHAGVDSAFTTMILMPGNST